MSNAIDVTHAAYSLVDDESDYLRELAERMRPQLDRGRGLVAFSWETTASGSVRASSLIRSGGQRGDDAMLGELLNNLDSTQVSLAYGAPYTYRSLSEIARDHPTLTDLTKDPDMRRLAHDRSVLDFEMLRIDRGPGRGLMFSVLRDNVGPISSPRRSLWQRVGTHIAAGVRLRNRLSAIDIGGAEAVYDHRSKTLDINRTQWKRPDKQSRLLELIRAREHATALADDDPSAAMDLWKGLVSGRWSILDVLDHDGRPLTVLKENPVDVLSRVSLSERERQVAYLFGRGRHIKLIAYELGLTASTVRSHLSSALKKLNLEDSGALVRLVSTVQSAPEPTHLEDVGILALAESPANLPDGLTGAESDVAELVFRGLSNREIARRRESSERTVANQLASVYRKLDIQSRAELIRLLAHPRGAELGFT